MQPFPLCWPPGVPRTSRPRRDQFKASRQLGRCRDDLIREMERLRVRSLVISTNIPLRLDGQFRADARLDRPDAGVAVYFTHPTRGPLVIACDKWNSVAGNVWAIKRTIESIRLIARWGTAQMADSALGGLGGHLPHITPAAPWWVILEFSEQQQFDVPIAEIERRARELSKRYHPDSPLGGDGERFKAIREALTSARLARGVVEATT